MHTRSSHRAGWFVLLLWCVVLAPARAQDLYRQPGRWLDDQARAYDMAKLRGRHTVLTLAYGACRRICATSLRVMEQVQLLADERRLDLNFVVVGLDPAQDTPADWANFRADHRLARTSWHFLSGDDESIRRLATNLGIRYWRYGQHTLHDFRIVLLTEDGQPIRRLDAADQAPASLLP